MQSPMPVPGSTVWIRETRWRVEAARRERDVVRLDVAGRPALADVPRAVRSRRLPVNQRLRVRRVRLPQARARLADLLRRRRRQPAPSDRGRRPIVDLLPHQLEPALAILGGARRVLIADEVGLGKTIQAGFVLTELQRRQPAFRALVIVPSVAAAAVGARAGASLSASTRFAPTRPELQQLTQRRRTRRRSVAPRRRLAGVARLPEAAARVRRPSSSSRGTS